MMREAVFNKLNHTTGIEDKQVLDLFTGSGLMGLEFVSRGAAMVYSVDKDNKNIKALTDIVKAKELENIEIIRDDAFRFLRNCHESFDLIYADPPYDLPNMQELADLAVAVLNAGGWFLLEHRPGVKFTGPVKETVKHGSTSITIFAN